MNKDTQQPTPEEIDQVIKRAAFDYVTTAFRENREPEGSDFFVAGAEWAFGYASLPKQGEVSGLNKTDWQNTLTKQLERLRLMPEHIHTNTIIQDLERLYDSLQSLETPKKEGEVKPQPVDAVIKQQDEIIGRLTRESEDLKDTASRRKEWLRKAKKDAGFDDNMSFDDVFKAALSAYNIAKQQKRAQ